MIKEIKNKTMQIRINNEDYEYFKIASLAIGQSPSQMVRMFIETTINSLKLKEKRGEINLEDFKAVLNDKL